MVIPPLILATYALCKKHPLHEVLLVDPVRCGPPHEGFCLLVTKFEAALVALKVVNEVLTTETDNCLSLLPPAVCHASDSVPCKVSRDVNSRLHDVPLSHCVSATQCHICKARSVFLKLLTANVDYQGFNCIWRFAWLCGTNGDTLKLVDGGCPAEDHGKKLTGTAMVVAGNSHWRDGNVLW